MRGLKVDVPEHGHISVRPMNLVEVDVVRLQAPQAALDGRKDVWCVHARGPAAQPCHLSRWACNLGGNDSLVPAPRRPAQPPSQVLLAPPLRVQGFRFRVRRCAGTPAGEGTQEQGGTSTRGGGGEHKRSREARGKGSSSGIHEESKLSYPEVTRSLCVMSSCTYSDSLSLRVERR